MKCFVLFLWISLIVILQAEAAKIPQNDNATLCEWCSSYPECPTTDSSFRLNRTIFCQDTACIIGIAEASDAKDDHSPCLLRQTSMNLQKPDQNMHIVSISNEAPPPPPKPVVSEDDSFQVISISKEPTPLVDGANAAVSGVGEAVDAAESLAGAAGEAGAEAADAAGAGAEAAVETGAEAVNAAGAEAAEAAEAGADAVAEAGVETAAAASDGAEATAEAGAEASDAAGAGAESAVETGGDATESVGAGAEAAVEAGAEAVDAAGATVETGAEAVPEPADGVGAAATETEASAPEGGEESEGEKPSPVEETEPDKEPATTGDGEAEAAGAEPPVEHVTADNEEAKPNPDVESPDYQGDEAKPGAGDGAAGTGGGQPPAPPPADDNKNSSTSAGPASLLKCFTCSSESEANCTTKPTKQVDCRPTEGSRNACYTLVKGPRLLQRGCLGDLMPPEQERCLNATEDSCRLCSSAGCNRDGWPRCVQCAGSDACALAPDPLLRDAQLCPMFGRRDDNRCFHYANATNHMIRGCASSPEEFARCQLAGDARCVVCATDDVDCNATPLLKRPQLACNRCDSRTEPGSEAALACGWAQSNATLVECSNTYPYYLEESCLSIHHPDMGWAVRDCALDFGACEPGMGQWCQTCRGHGCNAANLLWQHCVQCGSSSGSTSESTCGIVATRCTASAQPYDRRGCFTLTNVETNTTTRGCISDLAEEGLRLCQNQNQAQNQTKSPCQLCYESGCNSRLATSQASVMGHWMPVVLAMLMVVILQF